MSKTKTVTVLNFKAVESANADFNGCSVIILGGNNKGKTSLLTGIQDRIRGVYPEAVVTKGKKEGEITLTLTTGEKFQWNFDENGKQRLIFFTRGGIKTSVTKEIANRYFPPVFDIDLFLNSQPKQQRIIIQKLVGIDLTSIDAEYKQAYDERTDANRTATNAKARIPEFAPENVIKIDTAELQIKRNQIREKLNALYLDNKKKNDTMRRTYDALVKEETDRVNTENQRLNTLYQEAIRTEDKTENEAKTNNESLKLNINKAMAAFQNLIECGYNGREVAVFIDLLPKPVEYVRKEIEKPIPIIGEKIPIPEYITPELPDDSELKEIDLQIAGLAENNSKAIAYENYLQLVKEANEAKETAEIADGKVKEIEARKMEIMKGAKFPEGIELTDEGISIDGYALDKSQISTSKIYCTALRLAALKLGEVKTLHFDASTLDNITLKEIMKWAESEDLQLLIEMPDREGGNLSYEIIEA